MKVANPIPLTVLALLLGAATLASSAQAQTTLAAPHPESLSSVEVPLGPPTVRTSEQMRHDDQTQPKPPAGEIPFRPTMSESEYRAAKEAAAAQASGRRPYDTGPEESR